MKKLFFRRTAAAVLILAVWLIAGMSASAAAPEGTVLNAALFSYVPDTERFENAIRTEWEKSHPDVDLCFVSWDGYHDDPSEASDLFVFDAVFLSEFVREGYLLPLPEEQIQNREDLLPFAMDGCRVDGQYYAVPQILCTHLLYTRKEDTQLSSASNVTELYNILGDGVDAGERPDEGAGLLIDMSGGTTKVGMYLDALCDMKQVYSAYEETPDMEHTEPEAVEALRLLARMGGIEQVQYVPEDGDPYVRARWFAQGLGRAYIGYSEAMSVMGDAISGMEFRPFSYTGKDNIPLISGDVVGIRSTIEDDKKELAFDLLNILTGEEAVTAAFSPDETHAEPQYLLPARLSVYDTLAASFPAYAGLREIALDPGNCLYRIGPDAREFISRAKRVLPGIIF